MIFVRQHMPAVCSQVDLAAEGVQHGSHLHVNGFGTVYQDGSGHFLHVQHFVGGQQRFGKARDVRRHGLSAAGDDEAPGGIQGAVHIDLGWIFKNGMPSDDVDTVVLQQSLHTQPDFLAAGIFVVDYGLKIDVIDRRLYAEGPPRPHPAQSFGCLQPGFYRDTTPVDTYPAQLLFFNHGNLGTQLRGPNRPGITAGTASDNDHIVHYFLPYKIRGCAPRFHHLRRQVTNFAKITRLTKKSQAPNTKFQINPNDPNSKIQTKDPASNAPNGIIPGSPDFTSWRAAILASVLVIEY